MSPIPVNPNMYLAQIVMKPDANPLANSFVNTLYFEDVAGGRAHAVVANDIETVLEDFYNVAAAPAANSIARFLSGTIDPALTVVKVYDLGDTPPRAPEIRGMGSWTLDTTALPNECAGVLSYVSGPQSVTGGTNDKTARGRIYLGPLGQTCMSGGPTGEDVILTVAFTDAVSNSAIRLRDQVAVDVTWVQYSRKDDAFAPVVGGFVDNRFDTQRRRGADATVRVVW